MAVEISNSRMIAYLEASLGDLAFDILLFEEGKSHYDKSLEIATKIEEGYLIDYLNIKINSIRRFQEDGICSLTKNYEICPKTKSKSRSITGMSFLENGLMLTKYQQYGDAQVAFSNAEEIFNELKNPADLAYLNIGMAILNAEKGDISAAKNLISAALDNLSDIQDLNLILPMLARNFTSISNLLDKPNDKKLLRVSRDLKIFFDKLPEYQKVFIPVVFNQPSNKSRLRIKAFGQTCVWISDNKITVSEWIHQKTVRELFFYLLAHPDGVHKDQIGLDFWPESSPRQLTCQFKNAIYRLRRAIGKDIIIYDLGNHSYNINRDYDISYDVEIFQSLIQLGKKYKHKEIKNNFLLKGD